MSDRREHVLVLAEIHAAENGFRNELDTGVSRELGVDVELFRAYRQVCAAIDEYELRHRGHEVLNGIPEEPPPRRVIERYLPPPLRPVMYRLRRRFDRRPDWADRWAGAISGALDDSLLTTAIERVTEPVPMLDGRSPKVCVAQLVSWASAVHSHDPERPLDEALEDALAQDVHQREVSPSSQGPAPQPPAPLQDAPKHLEHRIARILELRPDLSRPQDLRQDLGPARADELPPHSSREKGCSDE